MINTTNNIMEQIQSAIDNFSLENQTVQVLEAGCGSLSKFEFNNNYFITGIDISSKQLDRNQKIQKKILGDIQTYQFGSESFHIILCWHVLEHLKSPELALDRFIYSIKSGGVVIISAPNPPSLKGLVTKYTPHWFHILVYRNIYGKPNAGRDDEAPFKTYLSFSMSRSAVIKRFEKQGFKCEIKYSWDALFTDGWLVAAFKKKSLLLYRMLRFVIRILKFLSLDIIGDSEYILVFRKS